MARRNSRKPDSRQQPLLFDGEPRSVTQLRGVDHRVTGLSRKRWMQVKELAIAVVYCGVADGCRAYVNTLIRFMNKNQAFPICASERTFYRILDAAIAVGLVRSELAHDAHRRGGRSGSEREVDLARIAELAEATHELRRRALQERQNLKMRKVAVTRQLCGSNSLISSNRLNLENSGRLKAGRPNFSNNETRGPAVGAAPASPACRSVATGELDLANVRRTIAKILDATRRAPSSRDWQSCVKWAILAEPDQLGKHWLHDALEGLRRATGRIDNRWAYLTHCLQEASAKAARRYGRDMARVAIPAELLEYSRSPRAGRSCVAPAADQALFA